MKWGWCRSRLASMLTSVFPRLLLCCNISEKIELIENVVRGKQGSFGILAVITRVVIYWRKKKLLAKIELKGNIRRGFKGSSDIRPETSSVDIYRGKKITLNGIKSLKLPLNGMLERIVWVFIRLKIVASVWRKEWKVIFPPPVFVNSPNFVILCFLRIRENVPFDFCHAYKLIDVVYTFIVHFT